MPTVLTVKGEVMSVYTPHTKKDIEEMFGALGISNFDELYSDVPKDLKLDKLDLPKGISQADAEREIRKIAANNKIYSVILRGNGSYYHYIPAVVRKMSERSEFVTAYTPYQAELNQGILQSIFEYQTMICDLTGMEVSNASHYDGATASAEAILMCRERKKNKVIVAPFVKEDTMTVLRTYLTSMEIAIAPSKEGQVDLDGLQSMLDEQTACFYLEQPSSVGIIEQSKQIGELLNRHKIKFIMNCYPISLGLLPSPGECGADIATAEGQPLGLNMAFGGPYLGIMATKKEMQRKLPGRIVGQTEDSDGKTAYVLTLQAREQHIRREKAGSNICSNEALCALTASMYMAAMGPIGIENVAKACVNNAHYLQKQLEKAGLKRKYKAEFFNEFVTTSDCLANDILTKLDANGILGGYKLNDFDILWCATENVTKEDIDKTASIVREVLC